MNRNDAPFFSRTIRNDFRESLTIPAGTAMWAARYYGVTLMGRQLGYRFSVPILPGFEFYTFTYAVGHLILQVLCASAIGREKKELPVLVPSEVWNPAVIQFWQGIGIPIDWPPPLDLDQKHLNLFCNRWQNPIEYSAS
jgi:hypothetical protein